METFKNSSSNSSIMKQKENKSTFLRSFGDTPQLRVLDFLVHNYFFDYPLTEIARESNVGYSSLQMIFPQMLKMGILKRTRRVGKSDYFQADKDNPFFKRMILLNLDLIGKTIENMGEDGKEKREILVGV